MSPVSRLSSFPGCPLSCEWGKEPGGAVLEEVSLETFEVSLSCVSQLILEVHSTDPSSSGRG